MMRNAIKKWCQKLLDIPKLRFVRENYFPRIKNNTKEFEVGGIIDWIKSKNKIKVIVMFNVSNQIFYNFPS